MLEFPAFVLFGVYSPANSNGLRDDFRYGFLTALDTRIRNLAKMGKRVILTGDLNVSREEMDTAKADEAMRQEGLTREDYLNAPNRRVFNQLVDNGKVPGERDEGREHPVLWDLCREFHPKRQGMFTHWEQKINARPGNFGSRIDYVLCSIEMKSWFSEANIQEGLMGSDHCPVYAVTKPVVDDRGEQVHILDIMNPPGMFKNGIRVRNFSTAKDLLPLSGKLLPEFDKRRSIKDMFTKKTASSSQDILPAPSAANRDELQALNSLHEPAVPSSLFTSKPSSQSTASTSPLNSPEKRRASSTSAAKPIKKKKSSIGASSNPQSALAAGQQSLKGFFTPKTITKPESSVDVASQQGVPDTKPPDDSASEGVVAPSPTPAPVLDEPFIDPQESRESWTKLFSRKPPPRCESHNEPCISLTTKKPGMNFGRQFWICPR